MGGTLGWVVVALGGVVGVAPADHAKAQITYTVRMVEVEGLDWRASVFDRLKPVTRQGGATIWTVSRDASGRLIKEVSRCPHTNVLQAPKVTALSGAAAVVHCRHNQPFVMQAAWSGDDVATEPTMSENLRVGWHTTMVGRKLDQGILVQVVIEDTVVKAVHHVKVKRPAEHTCEVADCEKPAEPTAAFHFVCGTVSKDSLAACCSDDRAGKDGAVHNVSLDVPEIDTHEVLGEWLIPRGEALLVSFGAYTVADEDGLAVVKERLALIEAEESNAPTAMLAPKAFKPVPVSVPAPLPSAPKVSPPVFASPDQANVSIVPLLPSAAIRVPVPEPPAPGRVASPPMPSRSIPQGVHADGTSAELPPLPSDEAEPESGSTSESSEPMPSPQTKKIPLPKPIAKPTTADSSTNKAEFTLPKAVGMFVPSFFLPGQSSSFQFELPIKPFSLKLPFGQKLEIELVGRVVPETSTSDDNASTPRIATSTAGSR